MPLPPASGLAGGWPFWRSWLWRSASSCDTHDTGDAMILTFEGVVEFGDKYRCSEGGDNRGYLWIGGRDVLSEIDAGGWSGPVTVAWADERYSGPLAYDIGWGYGEYTPVDPDKLTVGPHNILDLIESYSGQQLRLWMSDESFNRLDFATEWDAMELE
jgi:hypothetical protein